MFSPVRFLSDMCGYAGAIVAHLSEGDIDSLYAVASVHLHCTVSEYATRVHLKKVTARTVIGGIIGQPVVIREPAHTYASMNQLPVSVAISDYNHGVWEQVFVGGVHDGLAKNWHFGNFAFTAVTEVARVDVPCGQISYDPETIFESIYDRVDHTWTITEIRIYVFGYQFRLKLCNERLDLVFINLREPSVPTGSWCERGTRSE
ncbi:hypothetical protein Mapa_008417 [Marchantia paleacea]|nr:hypothetical protein Mapa_008417 [Marchantia paleacea]